MTPTVRARVATSYAMEWSEDESTTTTWGHERAQPAIQYATSFIQRAPVSSTPPPAPPQPQVRTDQVQVVRYEMPPPPSFTTSSYAPPPRPQLALAETFAIPDTLETELGTSERLLGAVVWTVLSAAGLFCALLFMRLIVSEGTNAPSPSIQPEAAPSAPVTPHLPEVVAAPAEAPKAAEIEVAAKPEPKAAAPIANAEPTPAAPKLVAPKVVQPKHAAKLSAPKPVAAKPSAPKHVATPSPKPQKTAVHVASAPVATAAPAMGTFRVNSLPWSEVFVDGQSVGNTPQMGLPLPAGHHKIKLVNPQLEMTKVFTVQIGPGQVVTKTINLSQ